MGMPIPAHKHIHGQVSHCVSVYLDGVHIHHPVSMPVVDYNGVSCGMFSCTLNSRVQRAFKGFMCFRLLSYSNHKHFRNMFLDSDNLSVTRSQARSNPDQYWQLNDAMRVGSVLFAWMTEGITGPPAARTERLGTEPATSRWPLWSWPMSVTATLSNVQC